MTRQLPGLALLLAAAIGCAPAPAGAATAATRTFSPSRHHGATVVFKLRGVAPDRIRAAYLKTRRHKRKLGLDRVRAAARKGTLRLRLSRGGRHTKLILVMGRAAPPTTRGSSPTTPASGPRASGSDVQPAFPIRAAFYYPWYPETWTVGGVPTHFTPTLGFYDSTSDNVIQQHVNAMRYAGIEAGISSWWGQGHRTDTRFQTLLSTTDSMASPFRWSLYYESESTGDPSAATIASDLAYIRDHYGSDPSFFRVNGRFVVFVYSSGDGCDMADRWKQANAGINAYIVLKVFHGFKTCASQPDGWHQYGPASAAISQDGYSYSISPGFWKADETTPRLARDLTRFKQNVRDMIASNAPFQLVTTFNEWGEGTAVESASEWSSSSGYGGYLDALHNGGQ
jgi:hypothetical protein